MGVWVGGLSLGLMGGSSTSNAAACLEWGEREEEAAFPILLARWPKRTHSLTRGRRKKGKEEVEREKQCLGLLRT